MVAHNPFDDAPAAATSVSNHSAALSSGGQAYPVVHSPMTTMMQHKPLSSSSGRHYIKFAAVGVHSDFVYISDKFTDQNFILLEIFH